MKSVYAIKVENAMKEFRLPSLFFRVQGDRCEFLRGVPVLLQQYVQEWIEEDYLNAWKERTEAISVNVSLLFLGSEDLKVVVSGLPPRS
jgi:hypothetical protein